MIGFHKLSRISWNIKIKKILMTDFNSVSEKVNFSEEEEKIFKYWNEIDAFKLQLEKTKDFEKFTFYDGPPFATGLPHYGHITAGTIKDVVTRYAS
jgi:isoleucyl-tRNA synthetase